MGGGKDDNSAISNGGSSPDVSNRGNIFNSFIFIPFLMEKKLLILAWSNHRIMLKMHMR